MAVKILYFAIKHKKVKLLRRALEIILRYIFGIEISANMNLGTGLQLPHNGLGVVIHPKTSIGNNVKILQNVTIGGRGDEKLPIIKDNVEIGAGAIILGGVSIGENCKIGANAVVIRDVPANSTAVGVPARIINQ